MSNVDKFKVISIRLKDELDDIDGQIVNVQQQLNELKEQRNKKLEEIAFNDYNIQNIIHHESPSLGFLSFDSIKLLLSYLAQYKHQNLYCINKHFRSYKLATYYYKLTKAKSIDFYFNQNGFRDNLLKSVVNPSQQISLQFVNNSHVSDTKCLADVHSLVIKGCTKVKDISPLGNIHYLDLTGTKGFKNISALTNVNTLILDDCSAKITNFRKLNNIRTFKITKNKYINDVSSLANCENLTLISCFGISDISHFKNLKKLTLEYTSVKSFESLSDNKDLKVLELIFSPVKFTSDMMKLPFQDFNNMEKVYIQNCSTIGEIKNLNSIEKLSIQSCGCLTKIDTVNDSKEIKISACPNLSAIRNIINVEGNLSIKELTNLETISGINSIGYLELINLRSLTTVEHVTGISSANLLSVSLSNFTFLIGNPLIKLELTACPSLVDISYLGFCPDVTIGDCNGIVDVSCLVNCDRVVIRNCRRVTDVSALGNVHVLTVCYSLGFYNHSAPYHMTGVSSLGKVHTLTLSGLDITDADIVGLGTVNELHMSYCHNIVDVRPLVTLKKLTLHSMRNVVNVSMLHGKVKDFLAFDNGNHQTGFFHDDGDY